MKNIGPIFGIILLVAGAGCRERNTVLSDPGVSLPEEPEMPAFAAETVALNDEAVELLGSDGECAMTLLDQAIAQQPDYHLAYANKGTLLIEKKQYHEAALCFEKAASLRPHCAEYYMGLAFALARSGNTEGSRKWCRYAIAAYNLRLQTDRKNSFARLNRALVVFVLGYKDLALQEAGAVLRENPDFGPAQGLQAEIESTDESDPWTILGLNQAQR